MRKIPSRNYAILLGIIVLLISACFAFNNLYNAYKEHKISQSPLASKEISYDDLNNTTTEFDADMLLVISYVHDEKVYKNELEIKKILNKYNLYENVTYLNITNYKDQENIISDINKKLGLKKNVEITKFPAVIYYKEGEVTYVIDSKDHLLNAGDFKKIIDMYELDTLEDV